MPVVCSSCDAEPPPGSASGAACSECRSPLVAVSEPENLIGTVIDDRFEIIDRLGAGGMGTVYRAKQRSIGRAVALKVIDRALESDVVTVKRFLREAQLASSLVHPNTVGVIEFGQSSTGRLYLVMELLRGQTLRDALLDGPFDVSRIVRIGIQLCDALEAAHALGIIHRDLKLENVMLLDGPNERDHIKVLDFGLARRAVEANRATATGLVAGTPTYLAPEVALKNADAAPPQDMYAVGVLLGELATGKSLWDEPTLEALFTAKLTAPPKLEKVPSALRSVIQRLLHVDPAKRPSADATRKALLDIGVPRRKIPAAFARTLESPTTGHPPLSDGAPSARSPLSDIGSPIALAPPLTAPPAGGLVPTEAVGPPVVTDMPITADLAGAGDLAGAADLAAVDPGPVGSPVPQALQAPVSLPTAVFEAPRVDEQPIEVDRDWLREKAAKAEAPVVVRPPRSRPVLWGVAVAVAMVAIVSAVVVFIGTSSGDKEPTGDHAHVGGQTPLGDQTPTGQEPPTPEGTSTIEANTSRFHQLPITANSVSIEIRTEPPGEVAIDGHYAGTAPLILHVPKSSKALEISTKVEGHLLSRTVVPDRDQTVEFTIP